MLGALLLLAVLVVSCFFAVLIFTEWKGPYHNTTTLIDIEGDGDLDVIVTNLRYESEITLWHQITIWFNQGRGRFSPYRYQTPPYLYLSTAGGDLDSDGDADMAWLRSDLVELVFNQGGDQGGEAGVFQQQGSFRPGDTGTPGTVYLGDLDNDGDLDGFVAGCCGMSFGDPDGLTEMYIPPVSWIWFNKVRQPELSGRSTAYLKQLDQVSVRDAALGDLDGDGDLDIFAAVLGSGDDKQSSAADLIFLNDGSGEFTDSGQRLGNAESTAVALGDLDGDDDLDALIGTLHGAQVWINLGGIQAGPVGEFALSEQEILKSQTSALFLEDLDSDGDKDALIAGKKQAIIWWNNGKGFFTRSYQRFNYSERHALAVGDFNGDGRADIFAGAYTNNHRIWINRWDGIFY